MNEKDNKYESSLYTARRDDRRVGGAGALTSGTRDTTPRWSPDGKWIAFVRPDEKDTPQIFLLPIARRGSAGADGPAEGRGRPGLVA